MNPIVLAIKGIPPREPNEPAASESQMEQLRSFQIFTETTLRDLSVSQAFYLMDQAKNLRGQEEAEKNDAAKHKARRRHGKLIFAFLIVVFIILGVILSGSLEKLSGVFNNNTNPVVPPLVVKKQKPEASPGTASSPTPHPSGVTEVNKTQAPPELHELTTLAGLQFPLSVRVIKALSLLNEAGKETTIPIGAIITIEERKNLGSLTMKVEGEVFIGNESRLLHKVRLP